jgi:acyl-CoA thioesterase-1
MDVFQHHERAAGMERSHSLPDRSKAARPAGRRRAAPGRRRRAPAAWEAAALCRRAAALLLGLVLPLAASGPAIARTPVILAFGDSLTAGYGLPAADSFPARLQAQLARRGIAARVINAGVSGDTTADGVARLAWALADKPDFVLLELGGNDMLRCIPTDTVRANLDTMIRKFQASGAKVLLFGMRAQRNCGPDYRRRFDQIYPELARQHHVPLYPFFLQGVAMKPQLNQPDMIHPNARGVAILVDRIEPWVARLVAGSAL